MLSQRVVTRICILVAVLWAASVARDIIDPGYSPDPTLNAIFGGTIGTAMTLGGKKEGKHSHPKGGPDD